MKKKITYSEPSSYFPKEVRKASGIGEFNKDGKQKSQKSAPKKK